MCVLLCKLLYVILPISEVDVPEFLGQLKSKRKLRSPSLIKLTSLMLPMSSPVILIFLSTQLPVDLHVVDLLSGLLDRSPRLSPLLPVLIRVGYDIPLDVIVDVRFGPTDPESVVWVVFDLV